MIGSVDVVPAATPAEAILAATRTASSCPTAPATPGRGRRPHEVKELLGKVPVFGICMGHQILGIALGGTSSSCSSATTGATTP